MGERVPPWADPRFERMLDELVENDWEPTPPTDLEVQEAVLVGWPAPARPASPDQRRLLDVEELAELLQCSRSYAYVLLKTRQIRSLKVGKLTRIPLDAVSEFIDRKLREADERGD
jgi:excisionase family DNA binding protein